MGREGRKEKERTHPFSRRRVSTSRSRRAHRFWSSSEDEVKDLVSEVFRQRNRKGEVRTGGLLESLLSLLLLLSESSRSGGVPLSLAVGKDRTNEKSAPTLFLAKIPRGQRTHSSSGARTSSFCSFLRGVEVDSVDERTDSDRLMVFLLLESRTSSSSTTTLALDRGAAGRMDPGLAARAALAVACWWRAKRVELNPKGSRGSDSSSCWCWCCWCWTGSTCWRSE